MLLQSVFLGILTETLLFKNDRYSNPEILSPGQNKVSKLEIPFLERPYN